MKRLLAMLAFVAMGLLSAAAFALPTVGEVQAEVQKGNYTQAESMMRDVVAAKPGSAKAHYIYAEILVHNKRFEFALQEARLAKQLDPAIGFTQPEKFRSFEQLLEREQQGEKAKAGLGSSGGNAPAATAPAARSAPVERSSGIPGWLWGVGFAVIAVLLWRMFSARRAQPAMTPAYGGATGGYGPNYSPNYGPMGGAPSAGSGMLGTGLAAAGGFAAGMLAEKMLDGHRDGGSLSTSHADAGGLTPGYFDNGAADELSSRSVDFGSGGDWDSGGGGSDGGGGGSDDW